MAISRYSGGTAASRWTAEGPHVDPHGSACGPRTSPSGTFEGHARCFSAESGCGRERRSLAAGVLRGVAGSFRRSASCDVAVVAQASVVRTGGPVRAEVDTWPIVPIVTAPQSYASVVAGGRAADDTARNRKRADGAGVARGQYVREDDAQHASLLPRDDRQGGQRRDVQRSRSEFRCLRSCDWSEEALGRVSAR